ncbi:MAG: 23S rRNA (adenine(2503)-C(2))-methyltransferase RlmN [Actinomycetaceae bacterium]|nr:23S rRNA (adenine(2503)-C(2))-methyltransferase RlmN [Actinomycetaceae bacterium]MDY5273852.1 23S rRNA (adenine(2503)-C(2))-methyltransferase RlmN [Arcanobacterium sp.]
MKGNEQGAPSRQVRPRVENGQALSVSFTEQRFGKPARHLADLTGAERRQVVHELGYQAFRADQLSRHYFEHLTTDPEHMSDIPAAQRFQLTEKMFPQLLTEVAHQVADGGATVKSLWRLFDGAVIESVLMAYPDRTTLCISAQAGCGMACPFCATGQGGLVRNLTAAEIVEEVRLNMLAARDGAVTAHAVAGNKRPHGGKVKVDQRGNANPKAPADSRRITNIVFMGMGEPLSNYKSVTEAIARITAPVPEGFGISARNITVSTVGIVPGIHKLAELGLPLTLAVSLHAPDDDLRDDLIPINSSYNVSQLLDAARHYFVRTGRRVSIEYALIKDMNDHVWRAELLAQELNSRGKGWAHVNPIPFNPTPGSIWTASTHRAQEAFVHTLTAAGIPTTIRDTRGADIDGACGQLAAKVIDPEHIAARAAKAQRAVRDRLLREKENSREKENASASKPGNLRL